MQAVTITAWLHEIARRVHMECGHLTQLDAAIGDGDHGTSMVRGFDAVEAMLAERGPGLSSGETLVLCGKTLVSTMGGASGPLYGSAFQGAGEALGDVPDWDGAQLADALHTGLQAIVDLGAAAPGDKTIVDAFAPAVSTLRAALVGGCSLEEALAEAADAAETGARATIPMQARKGRASYLGERSIGHQDPGATSAALIVRALQAAVGGAPHPDGHGTPQQRATT
jgi:dihydroxyacetone kinase-like protein